MWYKTKRCCAIIVKHKICSAHTIGYGRDHQKFDDLQTSGTCNGRRTSSTILRLFVCLFLVQRITCQSKPLRSLQLFYASSVIPSQIIALISTDFERRRGGGAVPAVLGIFFSLLYQNASLKYFSESWWNSLCCQSHTQIDTDKSQIHRTTILPRLVSIFPSIIPRTSRVVLGSYVSSWVPLISVLALFGLSHKSRTFYPSPKTGKAFRHFRTSSWSPENSLVRSEHLIYFACSKIKQNPFVCLTKKSVTCRELLSLHWWLLSKSTWEEPCLKVQAEEGHKRRVTCHCSAYLSVPRLARGVRSSTSKFEKTKVPSFDQSAFAKIKSCSKESMRKDLQKIILLPFRMTPTGSLPWLLTVPN